MTTNDDRLVFPIGQHLGPAHPAGRSLPSGVRVRVAKRTVSLDPGPELTAWILAHGPTPTTWPGLTAALNRGIGAEATTVMRRLTAADVLVTVHPGTDEAKEFANRHRLRPMQTALGPLDGRPGRFGVGVGARVYADLDARLFELWWRCGGHRTLWTACEQVAGPEHGDAGEVLDHFLRHGHVLLSSSTAYLDHALA
jgi:hypothetical protein